MTMRSSAARFAGAAALLAAALAACGDGAGAARTEPPGAEATTTAATREPTAPTTTTAATPTTTMAPVATTTAPGVVLEVTVTSGTVEAPQRPTVSRGDSVTIVVAADVIDTVHVHGYDLFADVGPAAPAEIAFTADIPGIFEVELEDRHVVLLELEVR